MESNLPTDIQRSLLATESDEMLLTECLDLSVIPGVENKNERGASAGTDPQWTILLWALFAAGSGGLLWNVGNLLFGWSYFMGSTDDSLRGLPAFFWGLVTSGTVVVPLLFLRPNGERGRRTLSVLLFTLLGGLCALLFFSSNLRGTIEAWRLGYAAQEAILVVFFALCLSVPPYVALVLVMDGTRSTLRLFRLAFLPTGAALLAFLATLIINRPLSEVLQLRGFAVGFSLRLALFICLVATVETPVLTRLP